MYSEGRKSQMPRCLPLASCGGGNVPARRCGKITPTVSKTASNKIFLRDLDGVTRPAASGNDHSPTGGAPRTVFEPAPAAPPPPPPLLTL